MGEEQDVAPAAGGAHPVAPSGSGAALLARSDALISCLKPGWQSEARRTGIAADVCDVISRCFQPLQVSKMSFREAFPPSSLAICVHASAIGPGS